MNELISKKSLLKDLDEVIAQYNRKDDGIIMDTFYEGDGYADGELVYDTWICPNCGKYYEVDYDNYKYCPECGQAIDQAMDWSDEDET